MDVVPFLSFPDEVIAEIGRWVALFDLVSFVMLQRANQRTNSLLRQEGTLKLVLHDRHAPKNVKTLEELALYEAIRNSGLLRENRIGFDYASTEIEEDFDSDDSLEDGTMVHGSSTRILSTKDVMERFQRCTVTLDSHCGTLAPLTIALPFSRVRGQVVAGALLDQPYDEARSERIFLKAWGKRIAAKASLSSHKYGALAREGKGWCEIYFRLGELELPERPDYWKNVA